MVQWLVFESCEWNKFMIKKKERKKSCTNIITPLITNLFVDFFNYSFQHLILVQQLDQKKGLATWLWCYTSCKKGKKKTKKRENFGSSSFVLLKGEIKNYEC